MSNAEAQTPQSARKTLVTAPIDKRISGNLDEARI
jgi:hypothetical protein